MARNISAQEAAKRLANAGFTHAARYAEGTANKGSEWQRGSTGGAANFAAGISKAVADGRFAKGVAKAGSARYDEGVRTKGAQNWPTGMQLGESRYIEGIGPFQGLWDQQLPTPGGAKNSPANMARMNENVKRFQLAKK